LEERFGKFRRESKAEKESFEAEVQRLREEVRKLLSFSLQLLLSQLPKLQDTRRHTLSSDSQLTNLTRALQEAQTKNVQVLSTPPLRPPFPASLFLLQLLKVIEEISKEKVVLEEQLLSLPLVSHASGFSPDSPTDSAAPIDEPSNSRTLIRGLQQKLGQVVADFRIQSMKLLETEKSLREIQQDKDIGDRLRTKLETQTENFNHQIALWEEKAETLSREIKVWQVSSKGHDAVPCSQPSLPPP
jgi:hypothetical protein